MPTMNAENVADPFLAEREQFPILARTNYLISNSLGAVPSTTATALGDFIETWATRGVRAWQEGWWTLTTDLGNLVSPLIGAGRDEVVFQPNVTLAHAVVFSAFELGGYRRKVVTDAMHFPSILYLIDGLRYSGAEVEVVPSDDGITVDTGRILDEIDEGTAFVNLSHILFKSSYVHDIAAIAARARRMGAITVIDGYQSVGALPVDVKALGVDVYIGGCLKWLCGGPGTAFLWVDPAIREQLSPRLTGWMSHVHPFQFSPRLERRTDAWRFLNGTPNIPSFYAARPGLEIINRVGVSAIRAKSERQTGRLLALADSHGYPCTTPRDPARRGGTVALQVEHGAEVALALKAREILCDYRPGAGIRLSPHFYTRDDELDAAIEAIGEILADGSWRTFSGKRPTVT